MTDTDNGTRIYREWWGRFFFQAEDGIRGAQESRGLGGVYKGQLIDNAIFKP